MRERLGAVSVVLIMVNSLYRQGIAMLLESGGEVSVIGQSDAVPDTSEVLAHGVPDVVIIDAPRLPDGSLDIADVHACRTVSPGSKIVVVSDEADPDQVLEVFEAGAHGYVLRENQAAALIDAVRSVARSEYVVDSRVTGALLRSLREMRRRLELYGAAAPQVPLTRRQRELLELVADGYTNRQIASALGISESTVKNHLHSVFARLGVASRSQAISVAVRLGLVRP